MTFLGKLRGNSQANNGASTAAPAKKDQVPPPLTPLQKMLLDPSPLHSDGSDKFYGMENPQYANVCYCNSILQCLYYSVPFREAVINYPRRSPQETLDASVAENLKYPDPNAPIEEPKPKPPPTTVASLRTHALPPPPPYKPEDKESPEYKKKIATHTLPSLQPKDNSASYEMNESLFTALKDLFEAVIASPERMGIIRPEHFLQVLRKKYDVFRTAQHQDAHEFLNILLNEVVANVEAETKRSSSDVDRQSKATPSRDSASTSVTAINGLKSTNTNTARWVHELFEGTLTSETQCLTCEKVSQRDEVFLDLSVDLERHSSVTSCLRKFSEEEMLCEKNKFHCDNCGGLQEAEKRMKLKRLPRVLALHLKRFKYSEDYQQQRLQKLFHRVVYPYYLRLFNTTDDTEDPDRLYELYAVVVHIGGGLSHGHYVAIIKTEDRGWLLFDDEMVEPVDKNYVRNFFGDRPGQACAYVLFYQETTFEAMQEELRKDGLPPKRVVSETKDISVNHKANGGAILPGSSTESGLKTTASAPPRLPSSAVQKENQPTALPPLPPTPKSPFTSLSVRRSVVQLRTEKSKEDKERKAAEKEKEKVEKLKRKEQEARAREEIKRRDAELKAVLKASKATKAEEDQRRSHVEPASGDTNGSAIVNHGGGGFVQGFGRLVSRTRSVSQNRAARKQRQEKNGVLSLAATEQDWWVSLAGFFPFSSTRPGR